jgi:DNA-binding HxlR family transcriptional regulator
VEERTFFYLTEMEVTMQVNDIDTGKDRPEAIRIHDRETSCRIRDILSLIGDKWSLTVIHELGSGPRRFTELRQAIPAISQRMLTVTVRGLERHGLLTRTVHATVPPRVDYALTPLGHTLHDKVWALLAWAADHVEEITTAQHTYDTRT